MAKWTSTILLLVALVALAAASTTPEVIELSDNNLVSSITADPQATWLVEFFAPWCGHCKKLAPIWDELAVSLHAREDGEFRVAKVDCTQNRELAAAFDIKGFPTIKLVKGDKYYDVKTTRTVAAFTEFAEKQSWNDGLAFPPALGGSKPDTAAEAKKAGNPFPPLAVDPEQIAKDVLKVLTEHIYASGILILIGFLVGLLAALLLCFPNPRVVYLQEHAPSPAATGPKVKEE